MDRCIVMADDRTGALEVAGALAVRLGRFVPVHSATSATSATSVVELLPGVDGYGLLAVVDIDSRHLDPSAAAMRVDELAAAVDRAEPASAKDPAAVSGPTAMAAHKIDSTLRGNWAAEVVARSRASGANVLVVAALPAAGRVCAGGIVFEHGVPVHEGSARLDARRPIASSSPAAHLRAAGAESVAELAGADAVSAWFDSTASVVAGAFAVCDAATDADLEAIAEVCADARSRSTRTAPLLVAGTSAAVAAVLAPSAATDLSAPVAPVADAVLVVCGSLHPVARRQVLRLIEAAGEFDSDRVAVLVPPLPQRLPVSDAAAAVTAAALAARVAVAAESHPQRALVVIGGDTAAAIIGDRGVAVGGLLAAGTPWGLLGGTGGPLIVTRSGGFGTPSALVELVRGLLGGGGGAE